MCSVTIAVIVWVRVGDWSVFSCTSEYENPATEKTRRRVLTGIIVSDKVIAGINQRGSTNSTAQEGVLVVDTTIDTEDMVVRTACVFMMTGILLTFRF